MAIKTVALLKLGAKKKVNLVEFESRLFIGFEAPLDGFMKNFL